MSLLVEALCEGLLQTLNRTSPDEPACNRATQTLKQEGQRLRGRDWDLGLQRVNVRLTMCVSLSLKKLLPKNLLSKDYSPSFSPLDTGGSPRITAAWLSAPPTACLEIKGQGLMEVTWIRALWPTQAFRKPRHGAGHR